MRNYDRACKLLIPEKEFTDLLKMDYLNKVDLDVCNYICKQSLNVSFNPYNIMVSKEITLDELIARTLGEVKVFGDDIMLYVYALITAIPINMQNEDILEYSCNVTYSLQKENNEIISNSGHISNFCIPKYLNEYSVFGFGHENMHALKETYYEEYKKAFTLGETIPLFFELLMFNPSDKLRYDLIRDRIFNLNINKKEYLIADKLLNKNGSYYSDVDDFYKSRSIYEYVRSKCGVYLNSFYYAIILYSMYKENPRKILNYVISVLNQQITTFDMLSYLDIYGDIKGERFEKELVKIKRLIKK